MLLWITDSSEPHYESEELIIRSPSQIEAISPNGPAFVVIDIREPIPEVMSWASNRYQATLWWKPVTEVPKMHCCVNMAECCATEFIPLFSDIYHRNGVINVLPTELESVVKCYAMAQVFSVSSDIHHHQSWPFGYMIHRECHARIDDLQSMTKLVRSRFNIEEMSHLITPDGGLDLLLTFSKA